MLERLLFTPLQMPFEEGRILIAILGTIAATYYDLFNNRNVPNTLLYAFLAIAILVNIVFYQQDVFIYAVGFAAIISFFGFLLYRVGQIGGADVFVIASIALLLPIHPGYISLPFNYPFIFSVLIFSGVAFSLYAIFFFARKVMGTNAKPNLIYAALLLPYLAFAYLFITSPFFSAIYFMIASLLLLASIFFLMYREPITESMIEKVLLKKADDEEVLAKERMGETMKKLGIGPVLGDAERKKLERAGTKYIYIYAHLPPFQPFLLFGLIVALFFGDSLFLVF